MTIKKTLDKIDKKISAGVYKVIRLVKINPDGKEISYIAWNKAGVKEVRERFDFIKNKFLDNELDPGTYEICCAVWHSQNGIRENYKIVVEEKAEPLTVYPIQNGNGKIHDKTLEQQEEQEMIDLEDYKKLLKENAELKAERLFMEQSLKFYKNAANYHSKNPGLSDNGAAVPPESMIKTITTALKDTVEPFAPFLEKFMEMKMKQWDGGGTEEPKKLRIRKKEAQTMEQEMSYDQMVNWLDGLPEENFDEEMDKIEISDPELYQRLCIEFQIEEEGEDQAE